MSESLDESKQQHAEPAADSRVSNQIASVASVAPQRRGGILDAFQVRSFRFQWPSDGLTVWAFEMEKIGRAHV
jgi:hypothetical protein